MQRRLSPRQAGLDRRRAARAQPTDVGHDMARCRPHHHGASDLGHAPGREAQHRGLQDAGGRYRSVDRVGADGHAAPGDQSGPVGRAAAASVGEQARRDRRRDPRCRPHDRQVPVAESRRSRRIVVLSRGWARQRHRHDDVVGAWCTTARRADLREHTGRGDPTRRPASERCRHGQWIDRGGVCDQLRRDVGPAAGRAGRRARAVAGARPLLRRHRSHPGARPRPADHQELRRLDLREERGRRPDGRVLRTGQLPMAVAAGSPTARRSCSCPTTGITSGRSTRSP